MECKANRLAQTTKWLQTQSINGKPSPGLRLYKKPKVVRTELSMEPLAMSRVLHVGIVGAGISGLRCANVLLNRGFKVTILEARDTIGGRVWPLCLALQ